MAKKQFESLEQMLSFGQKPLNNQLMVWMVQERNRAGPWVIRMTTEGEGMGVEEVYKEEWKELDPNLVDNLIQTLTEEIKERHGGTPDCMIRFQAYHVGESGDHKKHIHRNQRVQPGALDSTGLAIGTSEFAWNALVQQQSLNVQMQAQVVAMASQIVAANVALTNAFGVVATQRAVMTGGADAASNGPFGVFGMIAAVWLGPKLAKMMDDHEDLLSLDGINMLLDRTMGGAKQASENSTDLGKSMNAQILGEQPLLFSDFSWEDGAVDAEFEPVKVTVINDTEPAADTSTPDAATVLNMLAKLSPTEVKNYLKSLKKSDPDNPGRQWLKNNGIGLATSL